MVRSNLVQQASSHLPLLLSLSLPSWLESTHSKQPPHQEKHLVSDGADGTVAGDDDEVAGVPAPPLENLQKALCGKKIRRARESDGMNHENDRPRLGDVISYLNKRVLLTLF